MRLRLNSTSLSVAPMIAISLLALGGCSKSTPSPVVSTGTNVSLQPQHPVTPEMTKAAARMDRKAAPEFVRTSLDGAKRQISGKSDRPQFVLFILDGCPCSEDAQPIFNAFAKHWKEKVEFLGVIDSTPAKAKQWITDYRPVFPVISDSKKEIIKAYQAKQSVYSALISKEGQIVKLWPGYSTGLLEEMNEAIAKELGEEPLAFDAQYAPKQKTSGCFF